MRKQRQHEPRGFHRALTFIGEFAMELKNMTPEQCGKMTVTEFMGLLVLLYVVQQNAEPLPAPIVRLVLGCAATFRERGAAASDVSMAEVCTRVARADAALAGRSLADF